MTPEQAIPPDSRAAQVCLAPFVELVDGRDQHGSLGVPIRLEIELNPVPFFEADRLHVPCQPEWHQCRIRGLIFAVRTYMLNCRVTDHDARVLLGRKAGDDAELGGVVFLVQVCGRFRFRELRCRTRNLRQ